MARIIITSPQAVGSVEITTAKENHQYYIYKSGAIKYFKGETKYYEYYVETGTKEKSTIFKKIMVLEKNKYGVVKFPETGTGFRRYGTIDKGGNSTLPKEFVGEGDHYLLPQTAAALFGVTNDIAQKGLHQVEAILGNRGLLIMLGMGTLGQEREKMLTLDI